MPRSYPLQTPRVAILWRGSRDARQAATAFGNRLSPVFEALAREGVDAEPAVYGDDFAEEVRGQLLNCDAVLVWVDPITNGQDRRTLDPLLRAVASEGVWVSAHPDVILKMGAKEVLFTTRDLGWVRDISIYETDDALLAGILSRLPTGQRRVLKQNRGNGGNGVWSVEPDDVLARTFDASSLVKIQHALAGSAEETLTVREFVQRCDQYFKGPGQMIYEPRLVEGITRCYMTHDRLVGFSHQFSQGLLRGAEKAEGPAPGKVMFGPDEPRFQPLRRMMEGHWIAGLQTTLGIETADLPVIWDADFILGPRTPNGDDTFVLCEINISAVLPIPDEAPGAIAKAVTARLLSRRQIKGR